MTSPYGAHVAVVDVDRETGEIDVLRYMRSTTSGWSSTPCWPADRSTAVSSKDSARPCSRAPTTTNRDSRWPILRCLGSTWFLRLETSFIETPTPTNPLGAKGIGEAGSIAAPPTIVNAVIDALWHLGVREIDMPLTPERGLHAIEHATPAGADR